MSSLRHVKNRTYVRSVWSWLQWRILIKENSDIVSREVASQKITTKHSQRKCILNCLEHQHRGKFDRHMSLIYISKKQFFSFFVTSEMVLVLASQGKVSNSVAFHWCPNNLSLTIFHSIFVQHMQFQKDRSYSHPFAYTLTEQWVWLSRIHQLHSYRVSKHFIDTQFKLDFKLSQICTDHLNRNLGNSVNCHRKIAACGRDSN